MDPAPKSNDSTQARTSHAMSIDDAYRVERTLARGTRCITELVTIDGAGPFIRKKIPKRLAHRAVWAALGDCSAPGLPRIQATYETPDWFVVVHDYLLGKTLERIVDEQGGLTPAEAIFAIKSLCEIVTDLHEHNIIHRDISPSNVVLSGDDAKTERACLIDFGNARMTFEPASRDDAAQGTWGFAAPEQHGFAEADARSDVYSLGRLLGFMLTGARPGDSEDEIYHRLLCDPASVSPRLQEVIERACAFDRMARYQTAAEFAQAAKKALEENDGHAAQAAPALSKGPVSDHRDTRDQSVQDSRSTDGDRPMQKAPASPQAFRTPEAQHPSYRSIRFALLTIALIAVISIGAASVISALQSKDSSSSDAAPSASSNEIDDDAVGLSESMIGGEPNTDIAGKTDTAHSPAEPAQLELIESGWSPASNGYISYAFAIRNPSDSETIDFPEVVITGRSSDGSVVFSQPQVLSSIGPGETLYFGAPAGNGTAPDSVEFALGTPDDYNITDGEDARPVFAFSSVTEAESGFGDTSFTGEVAMSKGTIPELANDVAVVIVLRDEAGSIIYGNSTYVDIPEPGQSVPFECIAYGAPDYATVEAHALFW